MEGLVGRVKYRFDVDSRSQRLSIQPRTSVSDGKPHGVKVWCAAEDGAIWLSTYTPLQYLFCLTYALTPWLLLSVGS